MRPYNTTTCLVQLNAGLNILAPVHQRKAQRLEARNFKPPLGIVGTLLNKEDVTLSNEGRVTL